MTVEVDLNEYLAMKRALGYSQGVFGAIKIIIDSRDFNSETVALAVEMALEEIGKASGE